MCSTGNLLVHCYRNVKGAVVYLQTPVDLVKNKIVCTKMFSGYSFAISLI